MARKIKNKPTQTTLQARYKYVRAPHQFAGNLVPIEIHHDDITNYIKRYAKTKTLNGRPHLMLGKHSYPVASLVWLYHHGIYPDYYVGTKNNDPNDTRIENLVLTNNARACNTESGVSGITLCKSGKYQDYYRVQVLRTTYEEVPLDGIKSKGWTSRPTKIITKRERIHIGYFLQEDLPRALLAHKRASVELQGAQGQHLIDIRVNKLASQLLDERYLGFVDHLLLLLNKGQIPHKDLGAYYAMFNDQLYGYAFTHNPDGTYEALDHAQRMAATPY